MSVTAARDGLEDILDGTGVNVYRRLTDVVDPPPATGSRTSSTEPG
jgi:hypothetical protein